jgi:hypothetical protein
MKIFIKFKITSLILLLNLALFSASAQTISTYFADKVDCRIGDEVSIPVIVKPDTAMDVASISLKILYDPGVLTYQSSQANTLFQSMLIFNSAKGAGKPSSVAVSWYNVSPVILSDSLVMFTLNFTYKGGSTILQFDSQTPGNCEYGDANAMPIQTDGFINTGKVGPRKEK